MKKLLNKSLREISIVDAYVMVELDAGKLYHMVHGVFPDSFLDCFDYEMEEVLKILKEKFEISELSNIKCGVIWNVTVNSGNFESVINEILETHILYNPLSYECYEIN